MFVSWLSGMQEAEPRTTRQISAENPTGVRACGARAEPNASDPDLPHSAQAAHLGVGFKVRPFIRVLAGETVTIAEIVGSGIIRSFFLTSNVPDFSRLRIRMWWDDEWDPAVDVVASSFFCLGGPGSSHSVDSAVISVHPVRGCTSYWPMPFARYARIEITNTGQVDADIVAYRVLYDESESAPEYRFRSNTVAGRAPDGRGEIELLRASGRGLLVGTALTWMTATPRWWGEGEVKMYFGGDTYPTIVDNGTEDYFGGAWGFGRDATYLSKGAPGATTFSGLYTGAPYMDFDESTPREIVLYRWHIPDPIAYRDGIRVAVQSLGYDGEGVYEIRNDRVTATMSWYVPEARR